MVMRALAKHQQKNILIITSIAHWTEEQTCQILWELGQAASNPLMKFCLCESGKCQGFPCPGNTDGWEGTQRVGALNCPWERTC